MKNEDTPETMIEGLVKYAAVMAAFRRGQVNGVDNPFTVFDGAIAERGNRYASWSHVHRSEWKQGECYKNALLMAIERCDELFYCEGYAVSSRLGVPIHHAWVETADGVAVDPTWRPDPKGFTVGVGLKFSPRDAFEYVSHFMTFGILKDFYRNQDDARRTVEFIRERSK